MLYSPLKTEPDRQGKGMHAHSASVTHLGEENFSVATACLGEKKKSVKGEQKVRETL